LKILLLKITNYKKEGSMKIGEDILNLLSLEQL
jgi:hypothetical protein